MTESGNGFGNVLAVTPTTSRAGCSTVNGTVAAIEHDQAGRGRANSDVIPAASSNADVDAALLDRGVRDLDPSGLTCARPRYRGRDASLTGRRRVRATLARYVGSYASGQLSKSQIHQRHAPWPACAADCLLSSVAQPASTSSTRADRLAAQTANSNLQIRLIQIAGWTLSERQELPAPPDAPAPPTFSCPDTPRASHRTMSDVNSADDRGAASIPPSR